GCIWVINATLKVLGEEADGVRDSQLYYLPVDECVQGVRLVAGCDWYIGSEPQNIVLVDPDVIRVFLGTRITLEPGARQRVKRKALGALLALLGARAIERTLAFSAIEAGEMAAVER